jgi:hypothetical protein
MKVAVAAHALMACLLVAASHLRGAAAPTPAAISSIIRQSVAVNTADWKAQLRFTYLERDVKSKGSGTDLHVEDSKAYEVIMIEGSPYNRLVAIDNEPLTRAQADEEEQKLQREFAKRHNENPSERQARLSKFSESRAEEHMLMQQMVAAFNFRLVGEEEINGVPCYSFEAIPNPDYQPPVEKARVLTGMRGHMWIDKQGLHWVKVRAEVTQAVSFAFCLAKVKPGTSFELEQAPVGDVWLPKRFVQAVNASVLGLYGYRSNLESFYSHYVENGAALHAAGSSQ